MAPPKCFFKRPGEFYSAGNTIFQRQKFESYSLPTSPISDIIPHKTPFDNSQCSISSMKIEPSVFDLYKSSLSARIKTEPTEDDDEEPDEDDDEVNPTDSPLDLSCKLLFPDDSSLLKKLSRFLHQKVDANVLSNLNLNLDTLFYPISSQLSPSLNFPISNNSKPNPNIFISPPSIPEINWKSHQQQQQQHNHQQQPQQQHQHHHQQQQQQQPMVIDRNLLTADEFRVRNSPENSISVIDSGQENSSSETSSQCPMSHRRKRASKRCIDGKIIRPFKLYKGSDNSKSLLEALGITESDEDWLKSIVENRNVDDVFQFLSNVMGDMCGGDLSDEVVEKIKLKFGHIFENCNSTVSNPRMVRHPDMTPKELKTEEYWEKRRKNNEAAKRSREARRQKEEGLTSHCEDLQVENDKIRREIESVKLQIEDMKKHLS